MKLLTLMGFSRFTKGRVGIVRPKVTERSEIQRVQAMAVVYRFPDRVTAGPEQTRGHDESFGKVLRTADIVILPCIRRERIDPRQAGEHDLPTQLQA